MNIWKRIIHDDLIKWDYKESDNISVSINPISILNWVRMMIEGPGSILGEF